MKVREDVTVEKPWGMEIWFENNELYCGKKIYCKDNIWSSNGRYHYHKEKDETFFVIDGILELDIEGISTFLVEGASKRIYPGQKHRFRSNSKECTFIEVSTTHREEDTVRCELEEKGSK